MEKKQTEKKRKLVEIPLDIYKLIESSAKSKKTNITKEMIYLWGKALNKWS